MSSEDIKTVLLAFFTVVLGPAVLWMLNEQRRKQNAAQAELEKNTAATVTAANKAGVAAIAAGVAADKADAAHEAVNGRVEQLLKEAREKAFAEGQLAEWRRANNEQPPAKPSP